MVTGSGARADVMAWLRQAICGLHGHDSYLQFGRDRMCLKCVSCGHETHGWELGDARPAVRLRGDARRHVLTHHLVGARRVA
jgi:hypothetical protein